MSPINIPGLNRQNEAEAVAQAAPMTRLEERRDQLREKFAELQWDLGGAAYEMAARDYYRLDVLAGLASRLQVVDAELAEIERMARLEKAGASGSCSGCGSLYARGAIYCWRCGRNLSDSNRTVVGPSAAGQIVIDQPPVTAPPAPASAPPTQEAPLMSDETALTVPDPPAMVPEPPAPEQAIVPDPPAPEPAIPMPEPAAPAPEPLDPLPPSPAPPEPLPPAAAPLPPVPPAQAPDVPVANPEAVPEMRV